MAFFASHAGGSTLADVPTLGAVSAPLQVLAPGQLFVACSPRPAKARRGPSAGRVQPIAVHSSTSVPSGQRT
jgi:hypothetical protein